MPKGVSQFFTLKQMKKSYQQFLSLVLLCGTLFLTAACKKEETTPATDEAKVTGITFLLAPLQKGKQDVNIEFSAPDGVDGKQSPNAIVLDTNTEYSGKVILTDQSKSSQEDVTADYAVSFHAVNADASFSGSSQQLQVTAGAVTTGSNGVLHIDLKRAGQTERVSFPLIVRE